MAKQKTSGTPEKGFHVRVNPKTHKEFKMACINQGLKMQEAIEMMMHKFIEIDKIK
jgi:antitoxin component of RelBE/YafQ-DinJ toxin-antitoxin module